MTTPLKIIILTLFPEMFPGPLGCSILGRAAEKGLWELETINIRDFATDKHKTVDDAPYGGGAGMVMRADIVAAAIRKAKVILPNSPVIYLSPCGEIFKQNIARQLAEGKIFPPNITTVKPENAGVIFLCGHYEGIDQRLIDSEVNREISIGDYVLSGGELAAMVVIDAVVRNIPGVLGGNDSLHEESFDIHDKNGKPLLEYPHYTRPEVWEDRQIPEVLKSGHHANISKWRQEQAEKRTKLKRPDLLKIKNL